MRPVPPRQQNQGNAKTSNNKNLKSPNQPKKQTNIPQSYIYLLDRHKNPQQDTRKPSPATENKNKTSQASGLYSRKAKLIQYLIINVTYHINNIVTEGPPDA